DIPMLAGANLLELYLRVIPALPMQYEAYCLAFRRGDDLFQSDTKEAFLVLRQTVRIVPEYGEIPREGQQLPFLCVGERVLATLLQRHQLGFNLRPRGQGLVPARFRPRPPEPIRRIHRIILAPGACYFIARLL